MRFCSNLFPLSILTTLAAMLLAACGSTAPSATPAVLTMNFTPALRPFGPVFQTCTRMQPGLSLLINELPGGQINSLPADIYLTWGDEVAADRSAYQTGEEEVVFIVHPSNPVSSLSSQQLALILSGQASTWGFVLQPVCPECAADSPDRPFSEVPVQIWTYLPGDETLEAISDFPGGTQIPPYRSRPAPDPESMRMAVGGDYASLGFIPRRWLDESVKILEVRDLSDGAGIRPILAFPSSDSSPTSSAFIACLQQVLNP